MERKDPKFKIQQWNPTSNRLVLYALATFTTLNQIDGVKYGSSII